MLGFGLGVEMKGSFPVFMQENEGILTTGFQFSETYNFREWDF